MDDAEKELIRSRTDIVELISAYTALKRAGAKYKGLCPFHSEKTPSFTVDPEMGRWRCFGACQEGGDVYKFLEKAENLTFIEAAERLAERAGITLTGKGDREEALRQRSERDRLYAVNAAALQFFRDAYRRFKLPQEYAIQRGLAHETLERFGVGFAPDDWEQLSNHLHKQKFPADDAVKAGLIMPSRRGDGSYTDRFRGRLIFPILDTQERIVGFGGRLIVDKPDAPKYLNSPETPVYSKSKTLYALNRARKSISEKGVAVVVEGYMDAVAAHQAGIPYVVATCGTSLTGEHARLLRRYAGENKAVVLSFDADKAGVNAALKAAETITTAASDLTLRVLSLPPGEDPDSLIRKGDVAGFRKAIDDALTVPEFRLKSLETQHDLNHDAGSIAYLKEATEIIAAVSSPLERDLLIRRIARFHPSFGTNSLRAEESVRMTVDQVKNASGNSAASPSGNEGELDSGTTNYIPARRNSGGFSGGPTAFRTRFQQNQLNTKPERRRPQMLPPSPDVTFIRSLLDERWLSFALKQVNWSSKDNCCADKNDNPLSFDSLHASDLVRLLFPLLTGKVTPQNALSAIADEQLLSYAEQIVVSSNGPDLNEENIQSAVERLVINGRKKKSATFAGETHPDNEQLQQYMRNQRALRHRTPNDDGSGDRQTP